MTKAVVVEEEASDELREGAAWYEQDRAGVRVELLNAVDAVFSTTQLRGLMPLRF